MYAVGAGHLWFGYVEFSGFQLFCLTIAAHDLWLFLQNLSLYTVYLGFQDTLFRAFHRLFQDKGNVFFIITLDFIGYTGTVVVLIFKEFFNPAVNWLDFTI